MNVVSVLDSTSAPQFPKEAHPYLFVNEGGVPEVRSFTAESQSIQNGVAIPLSPIAEYSWTWAPWTSSEDTVVGIVKGGGGKLKQDSTTATSFQKNGSSILTATLEVDTDTVNVPSTVGTATQGTAQVTVLVCENPWPKLTTAPFRDTDNSPSIGDLELNPNVPNPKFDPAYHFSTMYCRDSGEPNNQKDDMPALRINLVPQTDLDKQKQILRQYLFSYPQDTDATPEAYKGLQQDGIGIRIVANQQHLSPMEWYKNSGFKGSPELISVDGYPALKDGGTVYVAASNRKDPKSGPIYSNIYLISHNPDAKPQTLDIFDQMVKYLTFNINLQAQSNVCVLDNGKPFSDDKVNGGSPVHCSADWECYRFGQTNLHCDSLKSKLARDTQRMADFQSMTQSLESVKVSTGSYPKATGGTYIPGFSTSHWNSWIGELGKAIGTIPVDPVNHFLTCGQCSLTKAPCQAASDCGTVGDAKQVQTCDGGYLESVNNVMTFQVDPTVDPASCWSEKNHTFYCPSYGGDGVSRTYQYQAISNASFYKLSAEFEVKPPADLQNLLNNWWYPPLPTAMYKCAAGSQMAGFFCTDVDAKGVSVANDSICRSCMLEPSKCQTCKNGDPGTDGKPCVVASDCGKQPGAVCKDFKNSVVNGSCRQSAAQYSYSGSCSNVSFGESGSCGDGVLNPGEKCEVGSTQQFACTAPNGKPGHKLQVCNLKDCQGFIDDIQHPQCIADAECGNGRIDKACKKSGNGCLTDADCGGVVGECQPSEKCDDGLLNGTYGHCAVGCQNYYGFCGDGKLSPGEMCDQGSLANGTWSKQYNPNTCALDCKGVGPYCGDGQINGGETCDGKPLITQDAICGNTLQPCKTDDDCGGVAGSCGAAGKGLPATDVYGHSMYASCVGWQVVPKYEGKDPAEKKAWDDLHKNDIPFKRDTQHIRSCGTPGHSGACSLGSNWAGGEPIGMCGDGIKDANEECDDGAENGPTKSCLNTCKKNVCGDGFVNTDQQIEECDKGDQNGKNTCVADYNSMCLSCAKTCKFQATSGGYCGDKVKNGPEQCDGKISDQSLTCTALGYDYGLTGVLLTEQEIQNSLLGVGSQVASIEVNKPECSPSCLFGGCYRCQDVPGKGIIQGHVFDGVYSNQPIPGARVSLMYKGVKTDEVFADADGAFKFTTLNEHNGCNAYRIVVDFYQDNPCTNVTNRPSCHKATWNEAASVDESLNGGYWSFTSEIFNSNQASFEKALGDKAGGARVLLSPRVGKGETLVSLRWSGNLKTEAAPHGLATAKLNPPPYNTEVPNADLDVHLIVPNAFTYDANKKYADCAGNQNCLNDVQWNDPGQSDLTLAPRAHLFCYHSNEPGNAYCAKFDVSPEVLKYNWTFAGNEQFHFVLNDWKNCWKWPDQSYQTLDLHFDVVTYDGVMTIDPPPLPSKKWLDVFSQDGTGKIKIVNEWMDHGEKGKSGILDRYKGLINYERKTNDIGKEWHAICGEL